MQAKKKSIGVAVTAVVVVSAVAAAALNYDKLSAALPFLPGAKTAEASIQAPQVSTMPLTKMELINTISSSGTVNSDNVQNVYTTHSYPIQEIFVKVGDKVSAGDVLALLDMSNLDYEIQQAQINLANAVASEAESHQSADNSVQSAEISLSTSKISLDKQQLSFDTLKRQIEDGTHNDLISAQNSIDSAKKNLETAEKTLAEKERDLETNQAMFDAGIIALSELENSEKAVADAQTSVENARADYNKTLETMERTKANLEQSLITSEKDLENSKLSYQNALNSKAQAEAKQGSVTSSVESQRLSLEKLQKQRSEAEIVSPINGTITEVNAVVGANASGILFVVQDMDDLYVSTNIKEFRVGDIAIGQRAYVTTDATGAKMFNGEVSFISPIAAASSSTTNVEYEIHVKLDGSDPGLRIGMNAYANVVLESRQDVYAVPYDAVASSRRGDMVYTLDNGTVVGVEVTTGLENDTMTEISGEGLSDGMMVITNASEVTEGQTGVTAATGFSRSIGGAEGFEMPEGMEGFEMPEGVRPEGRPAGGMPSGGMSGGMPGGR